MDFAQARKNMVDCQLGPMGVQDAQILELFKTLPRENFVPAALKGAACQDEDLPLGGGYFLMEPAVLARLVQAAAFKASDSVLVVGDFSGYSAAVISGIVDYVVADEASAGSLNEARKNWADAGRKNISTMPGDRAPYDVIFISGAVTTVPQFLLDQLAEGGRVIGVVRKPGEGVGRAIVMQRTTATAFSTRILFDAATPYLPAFKPADNFVF